MSNWRAIGQQLLCHAQYHQHRYLVVLSGDATWTDNTAGLLLGSTAATWISDRRIEAPVLLRPSDVKRLLGCSVDSLVFDAHRQFRADAIGVCSGALRGGNLLILMTPSRSHWRNGNSHYCRRLARLLSEFGAQADPGFWHFSQSDGPVELEFNNPTRTPSARGNDPDIIATDDQLAAVAAVHQVINGQRRRPLVLVADRGRGKSAALGMAAGEIVRDDAGKVLVTGASKKAVEQVFEFAYRHCAEPDQFRICWHTPEQLLQQTVDCALLIIDEAAGMPLPQLQALVERYPRIAMASTVHGYEGTGRGFMLRFRHYLELHSRGWRQLVMEQPVRWAEGDPLEELTNRLLVLDAALATMTAKQNDTTLASKCNAPIVIEQLTAARLSEDETLLRDVFSLLVLAHYKTSPEDLQQLLDNTALQIYRLQIGTGEYGNVPGIVVVVREGGLDVETQHDIYCGKRRPRGHALPEILLSQLGMDINNSFSVGRIMRIVIHPSLQRQGWGSKLLCDVEVLLKNQFDLLGANFALSASLATFWHNNDYRPVRIGLTRSARSGAHSAVMLKPCSGLGQQIYAQASSSFARNFSTQLKSTLETIDPQTVVALLTNNQNFKITLSEQDLIEVNSLCWGSRPAESIAATLNRFVINAFANGISVPDGSLLTERILMGKRWQQCTSLRGDEGRAAGSDRVKTAIRQLMERT